MTYDIKTRITFITNEDNELQTRTEWNTWIVYRRQGRVRLLPSLRARFKYELGYFYRNSRLTAPMRLALSVQRNYALY